MDSKFAEKKNDPRAFTIPCTIGAHEFAKALCDLGTSINLIPYVIYKKHGLYTTTPTSMQPLMADRSIKRPIGVLFDVLVKVEKFILPVDFVELDYEMDQEVFIILGCPFLATGRGIVDLDMGEIKFQVQEEKVSFKICKAKKQTTELQVVYVVDVENKIVQDEGFEDPL
ncbi:uncharacterized protein LOC124887081 [Capsicum annuum]|uniref:uncharacterized protein LOC124887081 n=1 Tax=Capsicum annuum TaxID=4072 RepID=UPI001FB08361|nr:uncharacterized protein LOC124887081 [Capsicum annuum]